MHFLIDNDISAQDLPAFRHHSNAVLMRKQYILQQIIFSTQIIFSSFGRLFDAGINTIAGVSWGRYKMSLLILFVMLCQTSVLNGQISNDQINYIAYLDYVQWTLNTENGAEEGTFIILNSQDGDPTPGTCSHSAYYNAAGRYCTQGTDTQVTNKDVLLRWGTGQSSNRRFYTAVFAYEKDGTATAGCDLAGGSVVDWPACRSGSWAIKQGNPSTLIYNNPSTTSQGQVQFYHAWRYSAGDTRNNALDFGTLPSYTSTKYHTNANRKSPTSGYKSEVLGYTNTEGETSPDVYYKFEIPNGDPMEVTISTDNPGTNFNTYLRLYDKAGSQIAYHDDINASSNLKSRISKLLCPGTYTILVEGAGSSTGDFTLSVEGQTITSNNLSKAGTIKISGGGTSKFLCPGSQLSQIESTEPSSSTYSSDVQLNYVWQKKVNGGAWTDINGTNSKDYNPLITLTDSLVKYRRALVTFTLPAYCVDVKYSNEITFTRYNPTINGGTIALNGIAEIEEGEDPGSITSSSDAFGSPQNIHVEWHQSVYEGGAWQPWSNIYEATGQQEYDIPNLSISTRYRRRVRNGCSGNAYSNIVEVNVYPANGSITGRVATATNVGVSNVLISARRKTAITGGPKDVTYTATTDNNGNYTISGIYYGADTSQFEVVPSLRSISFTPANKDITISDNTPQTADFQYNFTAGNIIYVNQNATGTGDGSNWTNAYTDLEQAIFASNNSAGDIRSIYIAKGVYKPSVKRSPGSLDQHKTFNITKDVKIYGGFAGGEVGLEQRIDIESNATVISGDLAGNDSQDILGITINAEGITKESFSSGSNIPSDNAYHVLYLNNLSSGTIIDGVIITGGNASGQYDEDQNGGGVYNNSSGGSSNPKFFNTLFVGNQSKSKGGAVYNYIPASTDSISISYRTCEFRSNRSNSRGGAIYNDNANEGTFIDTLIDCHFVGNDAGYNGGAIHNFCLFAESRIYMDHTTFSMNTAGNDGGAIYHYIAGITNSFKVLSSSFSDNGVSTIYHTSNDVSPFVINNSILWGGNLENSGSVNIQNSIIQGGYAGQINIYDEDPDFLNPSLINQYSQIGGYLQLSDCSPALDKGNNSLTQREFDILGHDRIQDSRPGGVGEGVEAKVDLGPYEINDPFYFEASQDSTDSWIHFEWILDPANCNCLDEDSGLKGVTVELRRSNNKLVGSTRIFPEVNDTNTYSGTFIDYVGPGVTDSYRLEINKNGSGTTNCHQVSTGSTLPFTAPQVNATDNISPDSILITWTNRSWLGDLFRIYRDDDLIAEIDGASIPGGKFSYTDVYRMNNTFSLINGANYDYFIETVSHIDPVKGNKSVLNEYILSARGYDDGSTIPINLIASIDNPSDRVSLGWDDMSAYCDGIQIIRGGLVISALDMNGTRQIHGSSNPDILEILTAGINSYEDLQPIYGKTEVYGVELLRDGQPFVGAYNIGRVPPNGKVSGMVLTNKKLYPVPNTRISLTYVAETLDEAFLSQFDTVRLNTLTDYEGAFTFDNVVYGNQAKMTITASPGTDIPYVDNPLTRVLTREDPMQDEVIFYAKTDYVLGEGLTSLTGFSVTPQATQDLVDLGWTYDAVSQNTYFNLYRDNELLGQFNDSLGLTTIYQDLSGIPKMEYTYSLVAYQIMDTIVMDTMIKITETFPDVAPVSTFNATMDNTLGQINVSWAHTSSNFDGFKLYRNGKVIYDGVNTSYIDMHGRPDSTEEYHIVAYRHIDDITYHSASSDTISVGFPGLPSVTDLVATPILDRDMVELSWSVPTSLIGGYNYTGFKIYRIDQITLDIILLKTINNYWSPAGQQLKILDKTGIPKRDYTYQIYTFSNTPSLDYEKPGNEVTVTFPKIAAINDFDFGSGPLNRYVYWIHPSDNIDGFEVYKGEEKGLIWDNGATYPAPPDFYYDGNYYPSNPEEQSDTIYFSAAYRDLNGVRYYSDTISYEIASPDSINFSFLTSFTASQDQAEHVKLCWEWNSVSALWPFVIERDNNIIDTIEYTARSYYDYAAPVGVELTYSIRALSQDQNVSDSDKILATGKIPSGKTISGRVYQQNSGKGLASVEIIAKGLNNRLSVLTDASGFYLFNDITLPKHSPSYEMTLIADSTNTSYVLNPRTVTIHADTLDLNVDFIDTYEMNSFNEGVAELVALTATPQPADMQMLISWSPDNSNYDGFEIFKGIEQIGTVLKGNPLQWIDDSGAPGSLTAYSLRAFQLDLLENKLYGSFRATAATFPRIEPIQNLTFTDIIELNQVYVQWSHPFDSHDFYLIQRNGINVGIVQTGNELLYIDSTGIPEQNYNYNIIAYARDGLYQSDGVSGEHKYPMVNALRTTVDITDPVNPQDENNHMNHLLLTWDYNDPAIDSFTIYRYQFIGNTKVDEQTIARVGGDIRRYEDYTVEPGVRYYYEVLATEIRQGNEYYSQRRIQFAQDTFYQEIAFPSNRIATPNAEKGWMELRFTYEYPTVDSFSITRQVVGQSFVEEIATFSVPEYQIGDEVLYIDKEGIPETLYEYKVIAHSKRNGIDYSSIPKSFMSNLSRSYEGVDLFLGLSLSETIIADINIPVDFYPTELSVFMEGYHTYVGDLTFSLFHPNGSERILLMKKCASQDDFNLGFSTSSELAFNCSLFNSGAALIPDEVSLDPFLIPSAKGLWRLKIFDNAASDGGGLTDWSINLKGLSVYPKVPAPIYVGASDGTYHNKIDVEWTYDPEINVDGFIIKRKLPEDLNASQLDIDGDVPYGRRMITDATAEVLESNPIDHAVYEVSAYRFIPGLGYFYSDSVSNNGYVFTGDILHDSLSSSYELGTDVEMSTYNNEDWAIVGTADVGSKAFIYKRSIDGSWVKYQTLDPGVANFGFAVSISGKYVAVGAPQDEAARGSVFIYQYNNTTKKWEQMGEKLIAQTDSRGKDLFGYDVDIIDDSEDYVLIGAPGDNNAGYNTGAAYIFRRNSNQWQYAKRVIGNDPLADAQFGFTVAIGKTKTNGNYYSIIAAPDYGIDPADGRVHFYKKNSATTNDWIRQADTYKGISSTQFQGSYNFFGRALDISGDHLMIGDKYEDQDKGAVYYYKYNGNSWVYISKITNGTSGDQKRFGSSISLIDGSSESYALIGAPSWNSNNGIMEKAYLYKWNGSNWGAPFKTYDLGITQDDEFGFEAAVTEKYALVSAYRSNNEKGSNAGSLHFFDLDDTTIPAAPNVVTASDGTFQNKVNIEWTYGSVSGIQSFSILRDGMFLASVTSDVRFYEDKIDNNDLTPGKQHFYSVMAKDTDGIHSDPVSDLGYVPANGIVEGKVVAIDGISPVEGVSIYATTSLIDGESFSYGPVVTGADGTFKFSSIYYGDEADITITASLEGHIITPDSRTVTLSKTGTTIAPKESNVIFNDKTAYTVSGVVRYAAIEDCGIENIELEYVSVLTNGSTIINKGLSEAPKTDADGAYSFVIDPFVDNLDYILIRAKDTMLLGDEGSSDTILYNFEAQGSFDDIDESGSPVFLNIENLSQINTINFLDVTTYKVEVYVENTCGEPLTDKGEQFSIKAFTRDGCFEVDLLLDVNGYGSLQLPPVDMVLVVTDISDYTNPNGIYLDYLMSSPVNLGLYNFHKDEARFLNFTQRIEALKTKLVYHLPPRISADFASFDNECSELGIVSQNGEYSVPVTVFEEFASGLCPATEGFLLVTNGAARSTGPDTIFYNSEIEGFDDYRFIANAPNVVAPHIWSMTLEYYNDAGVFQGKTSRGIFVEGQVGTPGNGIMVDAGDGTQEVPLPLFILRDPPGDGSYSTIEKGFTVTKSLEWETDSGSSLALSQENTFKIAGVGGIVEGERVEGSSKGKSNVLELTYTSTKSFSTSDSEDAVGPEADVIVGLGLAMQYGLNTSYSFEGCTAEGPEIKETRKIGLTPNSVETTWIRSIEEIKSLIDEYDSNAALFESGEEVFEENGQPVPPAQAARKFRALRDNWQAILGYHEQETNPFYYMCTHDFTKDEIAQSDIFYNPRSGGALDPFDNIFLNDLNIDADTWAENLAAIKVSANQWGAALLTLLDVDGDGSPDLDVTFDNAKLIAYNNAAYAIRELMKPTGGKAEGFQELTTRLSLYGYSDGKLMDESFAPKDEMAKNITFTGNVGAYTESYSQKTSLTKALTYTLNQESSIGGGIKVNIPNETFAGVGVGIIKKITEFESVNKLTDKTTVNISHSRGDTDEQSQEVSFTLDDNDVGDEISVTILKSIDLNHTPFFQLLGGETSCPWEDGSISRHGPIIQVLDENGNAGDKASRLRQVADEPVEFTVVLTNKSPTKEVRGYEVFLYNSSNPDNASLSLAGNNLGIVRFPEEVYNIPKQVTLTVNRGTSYEYKGLKIGIRPIDDCDDDWEPSTITLDITFESECSPVSIVSPGDNWLVNSSDLSTLIKVRDYNVSSEIFKQLTWEYRRIDSDLTQVSEGWNPIPDNQSQENPISKDSLLAHNEKFFGPGKIPNYLFNWTLDNSSLNRLRYPDGDYEIRVKAICQVPSEPETYSYSNIISGKIMRSGLQLIETLPADGSWVAGDIIEVSFNKNIECSKFDDPAYVDKYMKVYNADNIEIQEASFVCFNNKIRVNIPDMTFYDGQELTVVLDTIYGVSGNIYYSSLDTTSQVTWSFDVNTRPAYFVQDSFVIELYESESEGLSTQLINTGLVALPDLQLTRSTNSASWLSSSSPGIETNFTLNNTTKKEDIFLTVLGLTEGVYTDTLVLTGLPGNEIIPTTLPIKVTVKKRPPTPPNWEVDDELYPNSMTVAANFEYTDTPGTYSDDVLDQISVYINGELRGLGRIEDPGNGSYVAYITVYGSSADNGEVLEFKVWDSSEDLEFNGIPPLVINYDDGDFVGSSVDRIILSVDLANQARYIPLNQGWTWFSMNTQESDMSITAILSDIDNPAPGDRIVGQSGFAEYINSSIGWYASASFKLDSLNTEDSYMIYLANQADSIRVTGLNATVVNGRLLLPGWHWIGYPMQEAQSIETAITLVNKREFDQIRTRDDASQWLTDPNPGIWDGTLDELIPNLGYKVEISGTGSARLLNYNTPGQALALPAEMAKVILKNNASADTADYNTWQLSSDDYMFRDIVPLIGEVSVDGAIANSGKVAAFIDNDLIGVGSIEEDPVLNKSLFTLLMGVNPELDMNNVRLHFASSGGDVYHIDSVYQFADNNLVGAYTYSDPLQIIIGIPLDCQSLLSVNNDSIVAAVYRAQATISSEGVIKSPANVEFRAGNSIELNEGFEVKLGAQFLAIIESCLESAMADPVGSHEKSKLRKRIDPTTMVDLNVIHLNTSEVKRYKYVIEERTSVLITMYDKDGFEINRLVDHTEVSPGIYYLEIDSDPLEAGDYYVRIVTSDDSKSKKLIYVE